jgi:hypothetical protein
VPTLIVRKYTNMHAFDDLSRWKKTKREVAFSKWIAIETYPS